MELLPLSKSKLGTFYFKMTLQGLLCDIHFNSPLILHNSHMIQCVCFMRQTWHMKIKNRFLVWNTERDCRGKRKKKTVSERPEIRVEGKGEEKTGWDVRVVSSCPEWKQLSSVWKTINLHKFTAQYNWTVPYFRTGSKDCYVYNLYAYGHLSIIYNIPFCKQDFVIALAFQMTFSVGITFKERYRESGFKCTGFKVYFVTRNLSTQ